MDVIYSFYIALLLVVAYFLQAKVEVTGYEYNSVGAAHLFHTHRVQTNLAQHHRCGEKYLRLACMARCWPGIEVKNSHWLIARRCLHMNIHERVFRAPPN